MGSVSFPPLAPGFSPVECPIHLLLYSSTQMCWLYLSLTPRVDLYVLGYGDEQYCFLTQQYVREVRHFLGKVYRHPVVLPFEN